MRPLLMRQLTVLAVTLAVVWIVGKFTGGWAPAQPGAAVREADSGFDDL